MSDGTSTPLSDDAALRAIVEGVEAETGDRFFSSLARNLAPALNVQYAFVSRLSDDGRRFKILALWERGHFGPNLELPLTGTPCESVLQGESVHYSTEICSRFPGDQLLVEWGAQSYCGVPVLDARGGIFGHVAILDDKPMPDGPRGIAVMRIFAARGRAEVERLRMEDALREANQRLTHSEEQFRDFFEQAPLAYVVGVGKCDRTGGDSLQRTGPGVAIRVDPSDRRHGGR
jgi:formate hydrogenlyase transcriptional activator